MEIFADTVAGQVSIVTSGGDGRQGQDGANGRKGVDSLAKVWAFITVKRGYGNDDPGPMAHGARKVPVEW